MPSNTQDFSRAPFIFQGLQEQRMSRKKRQRRNLLTGNEKTLLGSGMNNALSPMFKKPSFGM